MTDDFGTDKNTISLSPTLKTFGEVWSEEFSSWMGALNKKQGELYWWAYTSTAKNLLSSPLGNRFLQVKAICEIVNTRDSNKIFIKGATVGQIEVITKQLSNKNIKFLGKKYKYKRYIKVFRSLKIAPRLLYQGFFIFIGFLSFNGIEKKGPVDICLFTYLDGKFTIKKDNYFSNFIELVNQFENKYSFEYLAYLYPPYRKRIANIKSEELSKNYSPIFSFLNVADYFFCLFRTFFELLACSFLKRKGLVSKEIYNPLLQEAFLHDLSQGGYLHNLLTYKSIKKSVAYYRPKILIYPFENKSLEKMILIGLSELKKRPKTVGYQHTSITPKHLTFLFNSDEANQTPLPDKIITVGNITKHYLISKGNYPGGLINVGCALRQEWKNIFLRNSKKETVNILLVLSSSKFELIESIKYFQKIFEIHKGIKLGVRPHINFKLDLLPKKLFDWVEKNAIDFSYSDLEYNLKWCDITAYVSSTVALENMMRGKPVINIDIGDYLLPDPVLGQPDFHYTAKNIEEFLGYVDNILELSDEEYIYKRNSAIQYVKEYFVPVSEEAIKKFIE